jgi:signal peptidase I
MDNDITPTKRPLGATDPVPAPVDSAHPLPSQQPPILSEPVGEGSYNNKQQAPGERSAWRELLSTIGILLTALVIALLMIAFVFRSYQVDGPSMQNTLHNGDKLIIWKVPRTWADITHHPYIPDRGDIIVFTESGLSQFGQTNTKQLIKRVIGLPGDRVVVANGVYTIYNKAHPNGFDPDKTMSYFKGRQIPVTSGNIDVTLGPDQLFVSGDNRPDSLDSRAFGPINANQIVGKLILRVFPLNDSEVF